MSVPLVHQSWTRSYCLHERQADRNHFKKRKNRMFRKLPVLLLSNPVFGLMRGKINLFGLDALVNMATAVGLHIEMRVREVA